MLSGQTNLAGTYHYLGRAEDALRVMEDAYLGRLKLNGEEDERTLLAANNHASYLLGLERFEEARSLLRKTIPVARRVLGESNQLTLKMRWQYARALSNDDSATLADHREAVETLEAVAKSWKRVFGDSHPETPRVQNALASAREKLARAASSESKGAAVN